MDTDIATDLLSALANPHRLDVFRLLVRRAPKGVAAGDIATAIAIAPSALSFHLNLLQQAGLISATREGRIIRYTIEPARMRDLLAFLTEDCCGGRPELCAGLSAVTTCR